VGLQDVVHIINSGENHVLLLQIHSVAVAQPLWVLCVSRYPKNSGWGVRHPKFWYTLWLASTNQRSIFHIRIHRNRLAAGLCAPSDPL